ncbi:MAG: type II toxin-antitoxin system PemK/MazF family toxin, partial [Candidatus Saccharimonadales bacterium]
MRPTITFSAGDVVIVKFPFTDLVAHKKRPAVIVSDPSFAATHGDLVVVALTSQPADASTRLDDWRVAGLLKPTWV